MRFASAILLTLPSITLFFSYSPTLGAPILSQSPTTGDLGPPPSLDIQDTQHAKSTLAHARFGLAVAAARHQLSVNTGDLAPHNEDTIRARGMGLSMVPDIEMVLARRIADEISDLHHRREITEPMPGLGHTAPINFSGFRLGEAAKNLNPDKPRDDAIHERDLVFTGVSKKDLIIRWVIEALRSLQRTEHEDYEREAQHALMSEEDEQACRDVGNTPWYNPRTRKAECTSDPIPARGVVQRLYQREV